MSVYEFWQVWTDWSVIHEKGSWVGYLPLVLNFVNSNELIFHLITMFSFKFFLAEMKQIYFYSGILEIWVTKVYFVGKFLWKGFVARDYIPPEVNVVFNHILRFWTLVWMNLFSNFMSFEEWQDFFGLQKTEPLFLMMEHVNPVKDLLIHWTVIDYKYFMLES